MTDSNEYEEKIGIYFDKESSQMYDQHQEEGIPTSMQNITQEVSGKEIALVLDIGSGPGSLLLELLKKGVPQVIGMDLSTEMNQLARKRIEKEGYKDQVELIEGSFLEKEIEMQPDAITVHRVLCCHPNRKGMIEKMVKYQPKLISITIPRDWKFLKLSLAIYGLIAKLRKAFRPYVHSQTVVDNQMTELGYRIKSRQKEFWWVTTTYERDIQL